MLQQNQQHHEGPHPPLPQSLPAPTIRKTYRSIRARSTRLLNSFFPQAVRALNSDHPAPLWNPKAVVTCFESSPDSVLSDSHNALLRCCPLRMPHAAWPAAQNTPWERGPCRSRSVRRASWCGTFRLSVPTVSLLCRGECGLEARK